MAKEVIGFNPLDAYSADSYSKLFDMSQYPLEIMSDIEDKPKEEKSALISSPDLQLQKKIEERFMREYARENSVNLPVKSSASAILKLKEDDSCFRPHRLFEGEEETGTERGIAYHRFLELCDFAVKDRGGIEAELNKFALDGHISRVHRELLQVDALVEILNMPVFKRLEGAELYREREFLCRLPANEILETDADDAILVQGAIDLLARTEDGYLIIDYKYSRKSDEELIETYRRQLELYKKAVALITRTDEKNVKTILVNIYGKRQILLN